MCLEIISEQGVASLWRGNMPDVYKSTSQVLLKVCFYDKVKHAFMPYSPSKYNGLDYYWRTATSATICMAMAFMFTYPLDLIHTRMTSDMTKRGEPRLFTTTFDCFNRTHLDEKFKGAYKGA